MVQATALAMNNALNEHGYVQADMPIYRAFQKAAGETPVDGYPGETTGKAFVEALSTIDPAVTVSDHYNPAYTFSAAGGWNGTTAPTYQQWFGRAAPGPAPSPAPAPAPPPQNVPSPPMPSSYQGGGQPVAPATNRSGGGGGGNTPSNSANQAAYQAPDGQPAGGASSSGGDATNYTPSDGGGDAGGNPISDITGGGS